MSDLRPAAAARAGWRSANVLALEAMHAEGKVSITDEAIAANMDAIIRRACQFLG